MIETIKRTIIGRPRLRVYNATDRVIGLLVTLFLLATVYALFFRLEYKWDQFSFEVASRIATNFFRFDLVPNDKKLEMFMSLLNTLSLGFVTTILGVVFGLVFGLLAARNLSSGWLTDVIRRWWACFSTPLHFLPRPLPNPLRRWTAAPLKP